ncbi:hypothetical protein JCM14469_27060 [Desulfatiferula olefinivorans]
MEHRGRSTEYDDRQSETHAPRALIVHGDDTHRLRVSGRLASAGIFSQSCGSVDEALAVLSVLPPPDLIVTALAVPGLDGRQFCRLLRSGMYPALVSVPILVLSEAHAGADHARPLSKKGPIVMLPWPGDKARFVETATALIEGRPTRYPCRILLVGAAGPESLNLIDHLSRQGCRVRQAGDVDRVRACLSEQAVDAVLIDAGDDDKTAPAVLETVRARHPETVCLVMVDHADPETIAAFMRKGAADFLTKPVHPPDLPDLLNRLKQERTMLRSEMMLTERTRALEFSESHYQSLFQRAQAALFRTGIADGRLIAINERYARMAGYPDVPSCMANFNAAESWVDSQKRAEMVKTLFDQGQIRDYETEIIRADGSRIWILFSATVYRDQGFIEGSIVEITQRKRIEEALRESEKKYHALFDTFPLGITVTDPDGRILETNPTAERLLGVKTDEHRARGIDGSAWSIIRPDGTPMPPEEFASVRALREQRRIDNQEMGIVRDDGSVTWINVTAAPLFLSQYGVVVTYGDITDRKRAETLLAESEARFKALHNASFGGITIHDKGCILDCNQGLSDITGYTKDELIGMDGLLLIAESARPLVMSNILSGYEKPYEAVGLRKNGEEFPIRLEARNVPYKGKMVRTVEFRDITEQKKAEEERETLQAQLLQSRKMESVGRLAGGVAHDFNNMLGVILGHAEMAMDQIDPDDPLATDLTAIFEAAQRSADLTRQLLVFARKQIIEPRVLDLNRTVQNTMNMLKRLIGENIALEFRAADDLKPVKMDTSQIDQILVNLCVNARDAITGVGTIVIETGMVSGRVKAPAGQEAVADGDYVLLSISDDGCGMDKATQERLFEPFFTTKELGKGTGLGLATLYGIVKQNKGYIHVDSKPGLGTTFRIYLPSHVETAGEPLIEPSRTPVHGGRETLLLVEDEAAVLHMVERMLTRKGYSVLTAGTPVQAMALSSAHGRSIDLLITDVIMPSMNGRDLAEHLKSDHPGLRVLYMSGYAADVITDENDLDEDSDFIGKPFGIDDLARAVRRILDRP